MTRFALVLFLAATLAASFASVAVSADEDNVLKLRGSRSPSWPAARQIGPSTSIMVRRHVESYGFQPYDLNVTLSDWIDKRFSSDVTFFFFRPTVRSTIGWTLQVEGSVACMKRLDSNSNGEEHLAFLMVADSSASTPVWISNPEQTCAPAGQ